MNSVKKLSMRWSKRENDMLIRFPRSADGHLVHNVLNCERKSFDFIKKQVDWLPSFVNELKKRGYDVTTLKFEVTLKEPDGT